MTTLNEGAEPVLLDKGDAPPVSSGPGRTEFGRAGTGGTSGGDAPGAGVGEPPRILPFQFSGRAGEYFRIWIVNVLLSVITLSLYAPWAKVRNKRYMLGNTTLDGHVFEYHATGKQLFKGRMIAMAILVAYMLVTWLAPLIAPFFALGFMIATPWVMCAALRFNARHTSWRNVRFDFVGTYWGALKAFILWPVLGSVTMGLMLPQATRATWSFIVNNHRFGQAPLKVRNMPLAPLYAAMVGGGIATFGAIFALIFGMEALGLLEVAPQPGSGLDIAIKVLPMLLMMMLITASGAIFQGVAFRTALHHVVFDEENRLSANFGGLRLAWILASNYFITIATLGLARPWCVIRQTNYTVGNLTVSALSDLSKYLDQLPRQGSAVGEEFAELEGMDFGLA